MLKSRKISGNAVIYIGITLSVPILYFAYTYLNIIFTPQVVKHNNSIVWKSDKPMKQKTLSNSLFRLKTQDFINKPTYVHNSTKCPDVLRFMAQGRWQRKPMTAADEVEMETHFTKARTQFGLPPSLQRDDGKCGNVTLELKQSGFVTDWFRALCDPKGVTPCCYNNICMYTKKEDCDCRHCYDFRRSITAEYATWIPENKQCALSVRNNTELCDSIDNMKIFFVGDSFIRHLYLAFTLLLKNNLKDGAMNRKTPQALRDACLGSYMFSEKKCRALLISNPSVCKKRVTLKFYGCHKVALVATITSLIQHLSHQPNSLVILGLGIHDNYNSSLIWQSVLLPILKYRHHSNTTNPEIIWHAAHAPGILKNPKHPKQNYENVLKFNKMISSYLKESKLPIFDSFNLTDGVNSFDGAHYGQGVNLVKARILIEYIKELRRRRHL